MSCNIRELSQVQWVVKLSKFSQCELLLDELKHILNILKKWNLKTWTHSFPVADQCVISLNDWTVQICSVDYLLRVQHVSWQKTYQYEIKYSWLITSTKICICKTVKIFGAQPLSCTRPPTHSLSDERDWNSREMLSFVGLTLEVAAEAAKQQRISFMMPTVWLLFEHLFSIARKIFFHFSFLLSLLSLSSSHVVSQPTVNNSRRPKTCNVRSQQAEVF